MTFSFIEWVLKIYPFNVIYPVIATSLLTLVCSAKEIKEETIVIESVDPSFLNAPSGAWTCT